MTRKLVGVASPWIPCGTLVRIRYHGHDRKVPVVDRCICVPGRSELDATARLAIHLTGHPPHTMKHVRYRVLY